MCFPHEKLALLNKLCVSLKTLGNSEENECFFNSLGRTLRRKCSNLLWNIKKIEPPKEQPDGNIL
jgi:hypothetical protein